MRKLAIFFLAIVWLVLDQKMVLAEDVCMGIPSSNNPFSCEVTGNCVWYAAYKRPDLKALMNHSAKYWYEDAMSRGFNVGQSPHPYSVGVFSNGTYGHVFHVESVDSDGSFKVTEMDATNSFGNGGVYNATYYPVPGGYTRNNGSTVYNLLGFIYPKYCEFLDDNTGVYCWNTENGYFVEDLEGVGHSIYKYSNNEYTVANLNSEQVTQLSLNISAGMYPNLKSIDLADYLKAGKLNYAAYGGFSVEGFSDPNDPEPTDPDYDPDIHINSLDIRFLGGSYVKEIQQTLYWGQSFQFEGRAQYENRSSQEATDIDADYRITDSRSNFNEDATKIDEDGAFNINPGEREENSISPITVTVSADGTKVTYSQGSMSRSFDVIDGFSKVYIFADIESDGDKDVSSPSDHDEYGKIELIIQRPPCQPNFTQTPTSGVRPLVVSFANTSISNAADCTYTWSFGDGGTSNVYNPSYVYNNAGTFTPKLTASSYSYGYLGVKTGNAIPVANPIPPSIVITNPTSTDKWRSDSNSHSIQWGYYNFPNRGTVNIHYTYDGGATWRRIESSVTNDGSRRWEMCKSTTKDSGNSYVRVCSNEYGVCGVSQKFYIDHASGCK